MGKRFYIHIGDTTTNAGKVLTGLSTSTWHGIPNAFDGDAVECPKCRSVGQIRVVGSRVSSVGSHGRQRALSGDLCLCKCNPPRHSTGVGGRDCRLQATLAPPIVHRRQTSVSLFATKRPALRWRTACTG